MQPGQINLNKKYSLGERIRIASKLKRVEERLNDEPGHQFLSYWVDEPIQPIDATIIGTRTLRNGHTIYEGRDEGYVFHSHGGFRVLLVVAHMNKKPFYVSAP